MDTTGTNSVEPTFEEVVHAQAAQITEMGQLLTAAQIKTFKQEQLIEELKAQNAVLATQLAGDAGDDADDDSESTEDTDPTV